MFNQLSQLLPVKIEQRPRLKTLRVYPVEKIGIMVGIGLKSDSQLPKKVTGPLRIMVVDGHDEFIKLIELFHPAGKLHQPILRRYEVELFGLKVEMRGGIEERKGRKNQGHRHGEAGTPGDNCDDSVQESEDRRLTHGNYSSRPMARSRLARARL